MTDDRPGMAQHAEFVDPNIHRRRGTPAERIEHVFRKMGDPCERRMFTLNLTAPQCAALLGALHFWRQQVAMNENDPGIGILEQCGTSHIDGIDGILNQLVEAFKNVLPEEEREGFGL